MNRYEKNLERRVEVIHKKVVDLQTNCAPIECQSQWYGNSIAVDFFDMRILGDDALIFATEEMSEAEKWLEKYILTKHTGRC